MTAMKGGGGMKPLPPANVAANMAGKYYNPYKPASSRLSRFFFCFFVFFLFVCLSRSLHQTMQKKNVHKTKHNKLKVM